MSLIGLDKIQRLYRIVKHFGIKGTFQNALWYDDVKVGKLMGVDSHGNKYYEDNYHFYGRNRWVRYADKFGYDYDASQVSPEWYGWLHYKTDLIPSEDPSRPKHKWMAEATENFTGTELQYVPYSTTRPKIEPWIPPKKKQ